MRLYSMCLLGALLCGQSVSAPFDEQDKRECERKDRSTLGFAVVKSVYSVAVNNALQYLITRQQVVNACVSLPHTQNIRTLYAGSVPRTSLMLFQSYAASHVYTHLDQVQGLSHAFAMSATTVCVSMALGPLDFLSTRRVCAPHTPYIFLLRDHYHHMWSGSIFYGLAQGVSWCVFLSTQPFYQEYATAYHPGVSIISYSIGLALGDMLLYCPLSNIRRFAHMYPCMNPIQVVRNFACEHNAAHLFRGARMTGVSSFLHALLNLSYIHMMRDT